MVKGNIQFESEDQVKQFYEKDPENNQVVIFEGVVYKVTEYKEMHPGGPDYLKENFGKNIDEIFKEYGHTISARNVFKDLPIVGILSSQTSTDEDQIQSNDSINGLLGIEIKSKFTFDYNKPLVPQLLNVDWTYDDYIQFINEPKVLINPVRDVFLFDNQIIEWGSKSPWYLVPVVWALHMYYWFLQWEESPKVNGNLFVLGFFSWTIMEYLAHRFVFHGEEVYLNKLPWNRYTWTGHFLFHGIHHAFPQDRLRLIFPPIPAMPVFYTFIAGPYIITLPTNIFAPFMCGLILGYVCYDMVHYYIHHGKTNKGTYMNDLKLYHLQHHYKQGTVGFGVSSKFWDYIFRTQIVEMDKSKKE